MSGIQSTGPNSQPSPVNLRVPPIRLPGAEDLRVRQPTTRAAGDSFQAPAGLAATAGGISAMERSVHAAQSTVDSLDRVGSLLDELRALVGDAGRRESDGGLSEIQSRIDSIIGTISDASAQAVAARQPLNAALPLGYSLFRNESITTNASGYAKFAQGQEAFGLDVVVTTSAQQAGFLLSFGGTNLNLGGAGASDGALSRFALELKSERFIPGGRPVQLSFASGTPIQDIATVINHYAQRLGLTATVRPDGTSLFLRSDDYGSDAFASVRIIDAGSINAANAWAGIYQLKSDNTNELAPGNAGRVLFSAASNDVVDRGQDVQAIINGVQATTKGLNIRASTDNWRVNIDLAANFAAGIRQSTPVAWFFPNPAPDAAGAAPDGALSPAQEFIPGVTGLISGLREGANDRLAQLKEQLRAALGTPQKPDEKQSHLETLAALRKALLGN